MANSMRWRYGDTNPVMLAVDSGSAIEIGDLVYLDGDDAKPSSALPDGGSTSTNQQNFHADFAGVAMQSSPAGEAGPIRIATTGVFEFACDVATFEVGDLIGAAANSGGDGLEDQKVVAVGDASSAVGRCVRRATTATAGVLVDVLSSVVRGGVQAVA